MSADRGVRVPDISVLSGVEDVTVLAGSSFCRSDRTGNIEPDRADGLFMDDTRVLSRWSLTVDKRPLDPLAVAATEPFAATFVTRAGHRAGHAEPTVVVERHRHLADGLYEHLVVRNFGAEPASLLLELSADADFSDLFDVKDDRRPDVGPVRHEVVDAGLEISVAHNGRDRRLRITAQDAQITTEALAWQVTIGPQREWRTTVEIRLDAGGREGASDFKPRADQTVESPELRMRNWRYDTAEAECESPLLQSVLDRSSEDLGSLRITDPRYPDLDVVAAGAPWFMALFGRDSLLTSWFTLPWNPSLARGTLHTLARLQGEHVELGSEEEPGRILHEVRLGIDPSRALGARSVYYGTVDATPLFVMLLGEAARWGMGTEDIASLLPAADRCLGWIEDAGDLDGDGFVEYQRKTALGLLNQGWKDSTDSIKFADGRLAQGPIALAEVQGYVYGAFQARARLAEIMGDADGVLRWKARAADLQSRFDEAFWLPDRGYYALALDGDKRPVDALASNQGHCLWTGIVPDQRVDQLVEHLLSSAMFTGWGVRTLSSGMAAYNPVSYHNGSVWPHDNALLIAGLARYGRTDAAGAVADGLLEAAGLLGIRLPELFCGFGRQDLDYPVPYPTSCSPQSWAAAAPIAIVTALLGLNPENGRLDCHVPSAWGRVQLRGIHMNGSRYDVDSETASVSVSAPRTASADAR